MRKPFGGQGSAYSDPPDLLGGGEGWLPLTKNPSPLKSSDF